MSTWTSCCGLCGVWRRCDEPVSDGNGCQGLVVEPIDFRAGINSLAVLVQESMALDPFAPAVFAFCNRRHDRVKLLFFDRSGFVLILKRLTEDKFRWPRREVPVVTLTTEQLHWILDGIDIDAMIRHPVRQYQIAG
ncbi:IS66 family insertion sequence element accessory protein TnpB [Neorhizobium galegae]|uniref:IS66 family insertion sequence element accessory protein TnpB n=1 Tax=Neorhizobium galegae TaxID=399 RepID=A0A6A1TJ24_NEOGA|nr:IS66 family insertion sequence element accessory protein TnpB [Neorhizobium galegae]